MSQPAHHQQRAAAHVDVRELREQVRRALLEQLGSRPAAVAAIGSTAHSADGSSRRTLVTEREVAAARHDPERKLYMGRSAIVTPLARDAAERYGVALVPEDPVPEDPPTAAVPASAGESVVAGAARPSPRTRAPALAAPPSPAAPRSTGSPRRPNLSASPDPTRRRASVPAAPGAAGVAPGGGFATGCGHDSPTVVAVGSDHAGFALKDAVRRHLEARGFQVIDFGTGDAETSVDYPDFVVPAAAAVARGVACRAIVVDCHGNASAMTANKVPGVRAAASRSLEEVESSREHNDINVLCLGQKVLSETQAREIVDRFLAVAFGGDRHARRIGKVTAIEQAFCRAPREGAAL